MGNRIFLALFALFLMTAASACGATVQDQVHARTTTLHTYWTDKDGQWESTCSGTMVSDHVVLTATHCLEHARGGMEVGGVKGKVLATANDGNDHSFVVMNLDFHVQGTIDLVLDAQPHQGDRVFWFGNPDALPDMYREGYVMGLLDDEGARLETQMVDYKVPPGTMMLDVRGWHGDSGSAVFNADGQIIGVVSLIHSNNQPFAPMMSLPFAFTSDQVWDVLHVKV